MINARTAAAALCITLVAGGPAAAGADRPGPDDPTTSGPGLWLDGPFGIVPAGSLDAPAPPAGERELSAEFRDAPIALEVRPLSAGIADWGIVIEGDDGRSIVTAPETIRTLSGGVGFRGPGAAGPYVLSARAVTDDGTELLGAWRISVPDRPFPDDGIMDLLPPELVLASGAEAVTGYRGDGCFVSLCATIGRLPPTADLPTIRPAPRRPLELRLDDGDRFRIANASLTPIGRPGKRVRLDPTTVDDATVTLPPPPPGAWLLRVDLVFDRERGEVQTFFRILPVAEGD